VPSVKPCTPLPACVVTIPSKLKSADDVAVWLFIVTVILPLETPGGTVTVSCVLVAAETVAVVPLNFTVFDATVVLKLVPVIIICSPVVAAVGIKLDMVGAVGAGGVGDELPFPHLIHKKITNTTSTDNGFSGLVFIL
jgi:hypothetical protein